VSVARNFPRVPVADPYLNHPQGAVWIWPPVFDLLLGGASRLAFGREATTSQVTWAAAAVPPLLGALQVVPLFFLVRSVFGRRRALLATAAYSVLPAAVLWGCFGHADHHVAEALNLLLVLVTGSAAASAEEKTRGRRSVLFGAALAVAVLTWQGAVFVAGLAFLWAAFALGTAAVLAGVTATALVAAGTALTLRGETVPFSFVSFGWFQPLLLAAGTLPLALLAAWKTRDRRSRLLVAAAAVVLLAVVAPWSERMVSAVFRGSSYVFVNGGGGTDDFADGGYLSYPPEFLKLVAECQPLLAPRFSSLVAAVRDLSAGFLILPFAILFWTRRGLRARGGRAKARLLVSLFAAAVLVMTLFQKRSVYYLGIFTALALADATGRLVTLLRRTSWRRVGAFAAVLLALALVATPGFPALIRVVRYVDAPGPDFLDLMARLRALDPPGVDPAALPPPAPGAIPGVMAPWAAGHFVTALAERPAAADPFAYGWRRQCRLFTTTDEAEAWRTLKKTRCRYLVTTDLRPLLPFYAAAAGRPPAPVETMFLVRVHESGEIRPMPFLTRVLDSRTGARMPDGRILPRFRVFRIDGVP
jgi:asparagine N-glycosylation enzyme membrane subunit Stt3